MRKSQDKFLSMTAVVLGHLPLSCIGLFVFGFPNSESLIFALFSSILHFLYQIFLLNAYKYGQLSQVYPVARGLSPIIIILISFIFIGEILDKNELIGVMLISVSLLIYGVKINIDSKTNFKGFVFAIITGCFIASYSLVDGHGARIAQNPIGFYSFLTIINAFFYFLYSIYFYKGILKKLLNEGKTIFWIGGSASYVAYAIVVWACIYLPIAVVSSLRETSILFAIILSKLFLKEKITLFSFALIIFIFIGIIFMRSSL